jgi:kinesin family protein 2/24
MPLLDYVCGGTGGRATIFAYGQTGSGKTHTMNGLQQLLCQDLFLLLSEHGIENGCSLDDTTVMISFFEMYGGFVQDLLNDRNRLKVLEDGNGEIIVTGLLEKQVTDPTQFSDIVVAGNSERTTHMTEANDTSSRSHAICQIMLRDKQSNKLRGKLSLVDLAGSERGADTKSHNAQRRGESAEINTSLLALKECVRALDMNKKGPKHVPYRASKLTLILKDCFTSANAMTTMIATVSPGASAADHSLNTLRYSDRIKEQRVGTQAGPQKTPPRRKTLPKNSSLGVAEAPKTGSPIREAVPHAKAVPSSLTLDIMQTKYGTASIAKTIEVIVPSRPSAAIQRVATKETSPSVAAAAAASANEEELRRTVQALFEQEEAMLNLHMSNIQKNAELLTVEGTILQDVQTENVTDDDIEQYVSSLEQVLDQKENMILALQEKLEVFQEHLQKEQELSKKVGALAQY